MTHVAKGQKPFQMWLLLKFSHFPISQYHKMSMQTLIVLEIFPPLDLCKFVRRSNISTTNIFYAKYLNLDFYTFRIQADGGIECKLTNSDLKRNKSLVAKFREQRPMRCKKSRLGKSPKNQFLSSVFLNRNMFKRGLKWPKIALKSHFLHIKLIKVGGGWNPLKK